jgi:hypothetical protein
MRVLIACEFSGIVRDAFKARGYDAWSCNLLPTERLGNHIQRNILEILNDRWKIRSRTFYGVADAMAEQWG